MLGHLVSNGHVADSEPRIVSARTAVAAAQDRTAIRQSGWLSRLISQLLHRR